MKVSRLLLALVVLGALVFSMTPGYAARQADCVLAGSVRLSGNANLLTTTMGSGSFTPSSALQCIGVANGRGSPGGSAFTFCRHNMVNPANPSCHGTSKNQPNPALDPIYDLTNQTPAQIASHANGTATFNGFTGGLSCTLGFEGHAEGTAAELKIKSFNCSNGFKGKGNAYALAIPQFNGVANCPAGPGGLKLCFRNLSFTGYIHVQGP